MAGLLISNCSRRHPDAQNSDVDPGSWRWENVNDYGRSLHPNRKHMLEVMPGSYRPGDQPLGVGDRLRALRLIADDYEAQHPDVSIEFLFQVNVGGSSSEGETMRTQQLGGVAPEIVNINTEATWPDIEQNKGWWVAFDPYLEQPNPYVPGNRAWIDLFQNQAITQAKRAPNDSLYCLTFDVIETGIYYNKNLFKKFGVSVPQNWHELGKIQKMFAASGYVPMVNDGGAYCDWAPDLLFDQCFFELLEIIDYQKKSAIQEAYYQGYLTPEELCWLIKKNWFSAQNPRWAETWRLLKQMRQYWQNDYTNADPQRLFITQRAPMFWSSSVFVRRLMLDPLINFEYGVFYLPPIHRTDSKFCCGVEQCVIGGAGVQLHVTRRAIDDGDLEPTIDFLRFITTPKHAAQIVNEAGILISNIEGATLAENLKPFAEIILRRYCTVKWDYSLGHRFTDHRARMINLYLNDGISLEDFLRDQELSLHRVADEMIAQQGWAEPLRLPVWSPELEHEFLTRKEPSLDQTE
jgi:raffinose/stachyose/melibiose transport system substrate-binding protein